jgi:hypothetical protein
MPVYLGRRVSHESEQEFRGLLDDVRIYNRSLTQEQIQTIMTLGPVCGNDAIEGNETCDGLDLDNESCVSLGFESGTLHCLSDCSNYDTTMCDSPSFCGNDAIEGNETCDGLDLNNESCVSLGFESGTLHCLLDCSGYNTTGCISSPICGNDINETGEDCDGNIGAYSCDAFGYISGNLSCYANCTFNFDECTSHPADSDFNGSIDLTELNDYIQLWKTSSDISLAEIIEVVEMWKNG